MLDEQSSPSAGLVGLVISFLQFLLLRLQSLAAAENWHTQALAGEQREKLAHWLVGRLAGWLARW